ncbi:MAG: hypothetical protein ACOCPZ_03155 [Natrialbaceae archaeon]
MADTDRPTIESRTGRLLAYLASNRDQLIVDAAVLLAWIVVSSTAFRVLALPQWAHYLVLFVGIAVYAKLTPSWERPYRSPE